MKATLSYLKTLGFTVVTVPPAADGEYHTEDFLREIDSSVCLVSMMLVNNENGCRLPVENVFRMVKRNDPEIITHCDAVQGFLKIPFKPRTLCADLVSVSGHKVHALKGVGALYIRHGVRVKPILCGSEQERGCVRHRKCAVDCFVRGGNGKAVPEHRRTSGTGFSASQQSDRTAAGNGRRDHSGHRGSISLCAEPFPCWAIARRSCCTIWSSGKSMFPAARHVPREPAAAYWNYSGQSPQRWTVPCESASVQRTQRRTLRHWYRDCGTHRKN